MKTLLLMFLFGTVSPYKQIDFNWTYTPNLPACTTQFVACLRGFTMSDTGSGHVLVGPSVIGPSALSWSYFPAGGVQYGTHTFALVANAYDENGHAIQSAPATVTVAVSVNSVNPPQILTGVLQ